MRPVGVEPTTNRLKAGCSASELRGPDARTMKRCGTCRKSKPLSDFNRKRKASDGLQEVCRECNRASSRAYYAKNRDRHIKVIVERTARRRVELAKRALGLRRALKPERRRLLELVAEGIVERYS